MANGNETKIKVSPVEVLTVREVGSGYVYLGICNSDGAEYAHAHPDGAQCDALIAALHKALGRATAPTSTPPTLDAYFEEKAKICDAGRAHGRATGNTMLEAYFKAEAATWRHAASLAVEASREAGPTVPRAAVEALRARLLTIDSGMEEIIIDAFDALLGPAPTEDR